MIFVATPHGVFVYERNGQTCSETARGLMEQNVTSIIAREGVALAGTTEGVFRSDDLGRSWQPASAGLSTRHVRWMAYHPDISDLEFAGAEPAGIFVSRDGAATWRECPEIGPLRDANKWFLPYSSGAGCVRGFAFHGRRAYSAVEVGGALRSDDSGGTWRLCDGSTGDPSLDAPPAPFIYPDVHSIATHPASPDLVFAATGGGYYASHDGGKMWDLLYDCYCRAVWIDPDDPSHQVLGPADGVSRNGRIEETQDGGRSWRAAAGGLKVPWARHMVERLTQIEEELFAVLSNGELLSTRVDAFRWERVLPDRSGIAAIAGMAE